MTTKNSIIIGAIMTVLISSTTTGAVFASGLSITDFH
jgi:hypothetical protein